MGHEPTVCRFHLAGNVNDRVPPLGSGASFVKKLLRDKLLDHKTYVENTAKICRKF
jgi:xylulose-5-phosphate/fructose-6-phosphate phosphoketolase